MCKSSKPAILATVEQSDVIKKMTPQQRFEQAVGLYEFARMLKEVALRKHNPHLSDDEIKKLVRDAFLYAKS